MLRPLPFHARTIVVIVGEPVTLRVQVRVFCFGQEFVPQEDILSYILYR